MKKVLHLIWRIDGGGIESFCINLIHALKDKPISFDFVVCGKEYDSESVVQNMGCKIYHLPLIDGKEGKKIIFLRYQRLSKKIIMILFTPISHL